MFHLYLQVNGFSVQELTFKVLEKILDNKTNIAIWGPVGAGKTVLLEKLALYLKLKGCRLVRFDFGELTLDEGEKPDYIVADHLSSCRELETIKRNYPLVPVIAVLYEQPKGGFDAVVAVQPPL